MKFSQFCLSLVLFYCVNVQIGKTIVISQKTCTTTNAMISTLSSKNYSDITFTTKQSFCPINGLNFGCDTCCIPEMMYNGLTHSHSINSITTFPVNNQNDCPMLKIMPPTDEIFWIEHFMSEFHSLRQHSHL